MKKSWIGVVVVATAAVAVLAWNANLTSTAVANADPAVSAAAVVVALPAMQEGPAYVGSNKCKKCHIKEYKSWEQGPHGKSLDVLKPGNATEAKVAANLDPQKDYTQDAACIECHVTGFGKPGGYEVHDLANEEMAKKFKDVAAVGCESCHGAGSAYLDLHEAIKKEKRQYTWDEMAHAGMVKADADTCTKCHNDKSPTFKGFNFEEAKKVGVHDLQELEYRADK